ncbi:lasso peptide [Plectonema cf. radiosum LEGE 06105]|uniref:Lasso peptide n=1 Tax=Plectonema cf. radiosum LEGE 06105 TaxID=945769 RepID=A0A8J7F7Q6_9CYAN|nr:lasso peptide [Plectonema radiosum]MBE9213094.1 lasso peptide [Plectonema cf. radiosum LEGE 06105]
MKKSYEAPKLTNHGTVNSITQASVKGSPVDTVFGEDGSIIGNLTGSLDACTSGDLINCGK